MQLVISHIGQLNWLYFSSSFIIEIPQFFLKRLIVFLIKVELEELGLFEVFVKFFVEIVSLEITPDESNWKMRNDDDGNDGPTDDLSSNGLEYLHIVLIVEHCSSQESQSYFMKDVYQIAKFVLERSYYY